MVDGWRHIDTAPRDGTPVLIAAHDGGRRVVGEAQFDAEYGAWWWAGESWGDVGARSLPEHGWIAYRWVHLPAPPDTKD